MKMVGQWEQFDVLWILTKECRQFLQVKQGKDFLQFSVQHTSSDTPQDPFANYNLLNLNMIFSFTILSEKQTKKHR